MEREFGASDIIDYRGLGLGSHNNYNRGDSLLAAEAHANGTATNANIKSTADQIRFGFDNSLEVARESRAIDQFGRVNDNQFRAELRGADQLNALSREINQNAREMDKCCCDIQKAVAEAAKEQAKCCCEAQLQQCKDTAALSALIIKENSETRALMNSTALDAANAKIIQLETINALRPVHPHS